MSRIPRRAELRRDCTANRATGPSDVMLAAPLPPLLCKHRHKHTFTHVYVDVTKSPCIVKNVAQPAGGFAR